MTEAKGIAAGTARTEDVSAEDVRAAISRLRRRVGEAPEDAATWRALAGVLLAAGRSEGAAIACDAALRLDPRDGEALALKARARHEQGRLGEAEALYRAALSVYGSSLPGAAARSCLAGLRLDHGDLGAAAALIEPLLRPGAETDEGLFLAARIHLARREGEAAEARLSALLDRELTPAQRAETLLLRGEALALTGRADAAFRAALEGKAIQRRLYADVAAAREGAVARLNRLADWFETADPAPWRTPAEVALAPAAPVPHEAASHVVLVGFPRSGTTLLEQALAGHPEVEALEERATFAAPAAEFLYTPEGLAQLARIGPEEAAHWRARYWAAVKAEGAEVSGKLFLDKQPAGTEWLPLAAKLFPNAKVLFALRDPRDVVLSCFRQNFQMNALTYAFTDLLETALAYDATMRLADTYRRVLPLILREVRYEALVQNFESELNAICAFLGLTPDPAMLDVAATAHRRVVRTPSAAHVRRGVDRSGLERWRAHANALASVIPLLAPWTARFGAGG